MVKVYTDIWNSFQFREPTYLNGQVKYNEFDLVKWEEHEPYEVIDFFTGKTKFTTRSCFSIGTLIWDPKESNFKFTSCGLRYLEYRIDGLEKFILAFCDKIKPKLLGKENNYE